MSMTIVRYANQLLEVTWPGFICSSSASLSVEVPGNRVELGLFDLLEITASCEVRLVATPGARAEAHLIQVQAY